MLTPKDYITIALSSVALILSLYNFYRARKDARAVNIRTIEQKRFEGVAILSEVKAFKMRNEAALEAVRFEAQTAGHADIVAMADEQILRMGKSIDQFSEILEGGLLKSVVIGTHEELLGVETFLGRVKKHKALTLEDEVKTARVIAAMRQKLLAASLAKS